MFNQNPTFTLAESLIWLGRPMHQKATGPIPGQGIYFGWEFGPWSGHM